MMTSQQEFFSQKDGFRPGRLTDILKASAPAFPACVILEAFVVRMMSVTWTPGGTHRGTPI